MKLARWSSFESVCVAGSAKIKLCRFFFSPDFPHCDHKFARYGRIAFACFVGGRVLKRHTFIGNGALKSLNVTESALLKKILNGYVGRQFHALDPPIPKRITRITDKSYSMFCAIAFDLQQWETDRLFTKALTAEDLWSDSYSSICQ